MWQPGRMNTQVGGGSGAADESGNESGANTGKSALRAGLLEARSALTADERGEAAGALLARALALPELADLADPAAGAGAGTVAAYVSVGTEPGTRELIEALRLRGVRVLLPVLLEDNDLDWARYDGPGSLVRAGRGLLEPDGQRLGPDAVAGADTVLLPGLAVDGRGMRLGRGGGSYDRVLARLDRAGATPARVVLLYAHEVLPRVPADPHDHPVTAAVTPTAVHRF